jgi:hypothetical protein
MSNTQRAHFALIAFICLLGMKFSILLWLPVIGLGVAAATGTCYGLPIVEKVLEKFGIEK